MTPEGSLYGPQRLHLLPLHIIWHKKIYYYLKVILVGAYEGGPLLTLERLRVDSGHFFDLSH